VQRWLLLAVVTGLCLRLGAACGLQYLLDQVWQREFLILGDANGYWELAERLAAGKDFAIYDPPRYVLRMPGFPGLLACSIQCFGPSKFAARLWLAALCALATYANYVLGSRLRDEQTGVIAAWLTAVSPVFVAFSPVVLSESTFATMLTVSLGFAAQLLRADVTGGFGSRVRAALCCGLTSAGAIYLKPSWILAVPLLAGVVLWQEVWLAPQGDLMRQRALRGVLLGGCLLGSMLLALLPWGERNRRVTGHFTLTTFWMGPSLYDGLNPEATGDSNMEFFDRDNLLSRMSEYEVDQYYRRAAWKFARENPGRTLELAWLKCLRYWSPWPNAEQFQHPLIWLGTSVMYLPALALAISAGWQCRTDWKLLLLTAGPILYFAALHAVFVSSLRYRLPGEYPLMVLTAVGWQQLRQWSRGSSRGAAA
jgi:4-amino-4-deoxy-L-arabinose transferase-like glycosyltransferase